MPRAAGLPAERSSLRTSATTPHMFFKRPSGRTDAPKVMPQTNPPTQFRNMLGVPKTIFDHIPKTGGVSITTAIEQGLSPSRTPYKIVLLHTTSSSRAQARVLLRRTPLVRPGEPLVSGWFYATLLRDPVDRFLSQYYFHRQYRQQVLDGSIIDPAVVAAVFQDDLESYLLDGRVEIIRSYSNVQAAHFATRVSERPYQLTDAQLLDAAITSLVDYDLVGVYTEIRTFLNRYCDALEVPRLELPRLNVTHGRHFAHEISHNTRRKLIAANTVDMALIDWARRDHSLQNRSPAIRATVPGAANFGNREIEIRGVECWETERAAFTYAERIRVRLTCGSRIREDDLTVGIAVHTARGHQVLGVNSKVLGTRLAVPRNSKLVIRIEFNACFAAGEYQITLALVGGIHLEQCYHWMSDAKRFSIEPGHTSGGDFGPGVTFAIEGIYDNAGSDDPPDSRLATHRN